MSDQITKFLKAEAPWFTDMDCNLSALGNSVDLRADVNRFGSAYGLAGLGPNSKLLANKDYSNKMREHLSIFIDAEDNIATRKHVFELKKSEDEAADRERCLDRLRGFRVVDDIGQRLDVTKLSLSELRKHVAQIDENRRLQTLSANEIRAEEAAKTPKESRRHPPYDNLPDELTANELTKFLRGPEARKLLRRHGAENLNDRLYGRG